MLPALRPIETARLALRAEQLAWPNSTSSADESAWKGRALVPRQVEARQSVEQVRSGRTNA